MIRLLRELIPPAVLALLLSEAALTTTCFIVASYLVLDVDPSVYLLYDGGLWRVGVVLLSIVISLYFHDLYTNIRVRSRILLIQQACQVIGTAFLVQALLSYLNPDLILPRWIMMLGGGLALIVFVTWRIFYSTYVLRAMGEVRILLVGSNQLVVEIGRHFMEHRELGFHVVGRLDDCSSVSSCPPSADVLGSVKDLRGVVAQTKPDRIIVGMEERRDRLPVYDLLDLRLSGVRIEEVAQAYEATFKRVSLTALRPSQLIFSSELGPSPGIVLVQNAYSLLIGLLGTLLFSPLMLLIAALVRLSSPGPVLFRQTRVGLNGTAFLLYKFRSMYADAEAKTGAVWAAKDDPRVTPVGRWIRKLRLDELPQFFNVLRGEMLIVGPRPERPEFVQILSTKIPYYRQRHCVKPGITGWAQISHEYGDSLEDSVNKLEYDLYYIKNLSFALDTYIVFHTLKTMLLRRGGR
jgi:exopolysaccharide biosynthesis polyprenyl glycosylphosphotransferase